MCYYVQFLETYWQRGKDYAIITADLRKNLTITERVVIDYEESSNLFCNRL